MLTDLKKFLFRGNVVDLAVAVVVGTAFKAVIDAFVAFIINPIIAAIFGEPDVTRVLTITLRETSEGDAVLSIGGFLQEVINFGIIGTALFVFLKTFETLSERRMRGETTVEEEPVPPDDIVLLTQIRDALRERA